MIILTLFQKRIRDKTYVVGDLAPISQIEVVKWLCEQMSCPLPPSVPLSEAHYTQRANRKVVPDKVLKELGVTLAYPSYKEGFTACLKKLAQD
jgi:hypothetical protein